MYFKIIILQKEVTEVLENHKRDNEEWVMKMRNENDEERRLIAEEKVIGVFYFREMFSIA